MVGLMPRMRTCRQQACLAALVALLPGAGAMAQDGADRCDPRLFNAARAEHVTRNQALAFYSAADQESFDANSRSGFLKLDGIGNGNSSSQREARRQWSEQLGYAAQDNESRWLYSLGLSRDSARAYGDCLAEQGSRPVSLWLTPGAEDDNRQVTARYRYRGIEEVARARVVLQVSGATEVVDGRGRVHRANPNSRTIQVNETLAVGNGGYLEIRRKLGEPLRVMASVDRGANGLRGTQEARLPRPFRIDMVGDDNPRTETVAAAGSYRSIKPPEKVESTICAKPPEGWQYVPNSARFTVIGHAGRPFQRSAF